MISTDGILNMDDYMPGRDKDDHDKYDDDTVQAAVTDLFFETASDTVWLNGGHQSLSLVQTWVLTNNEPLKYLLVSQLYSR
jgi:hypothetical protein